MLKGQNASLSFISFTSRSVAIWGHVVFATQEASPYDIAVVSLEEDLDGVPIPKPVEHFHEGKDKGHSLNEELSGLGQTPGRSVLDTCHASAGACSCPHPS